MAEKLTVAHLVWLGIFAGGLLFLIGVRFLVMPDQAIFTFGLSDAPKGPALPFVIGLRDLWLGALAIAFALLHEWRALALWLLMGALVCWADAAVVATNNGPALALAFHIGSGLFCMAVGLGAWRRRNLHP